MSKSGFSGYSNAYIYVAENSANTHCTSNIVPLLKAI